MGVLKIIFFELSKNLQKVNVEFDYDATGYFVDNRGEILEFHDKDVWSYRRFKHDRVDFEDKAKYNRCRLTWRKAIYGIEKVANYGQFEQDFRKKFPMDIWNDILKIESFNEVSITAYLIKQVSLDYKELVNKMSNMLNFNTKDVIEDWSFEDESLSIDFSNDAYTSGIVLGPIKKDQYSRYFRLTEDLPDIALYCSISYKTQNITPENISSFTNEIKRFLENKHIPYVNNILSEKVDL